MFRNWFRKKQIDPVPRWTLDDPTPLARNAPYTFILPQTAYINVLVPGDEVKLIFRSSSPRVKWEAERMWVDITEIRGDIWVGKLDNKPYDMPQLNPGDEVRFERKHIVDFKIFKPERFTVEQLSKLPAPSREFWDHCFVDQSILDGKERVSYLYREAPEKYTESDKCPDSGWRLRADQSGKSALELENLQGAYVALGLVLNKDDSWIHLVDEPVGSSFVLDRSINAFVSTKPNT